MRHRCVLLQLQLCCSSMLYRSMNALLMVPAWTLTLPPLCGVLRVLQVPAGVLQGFGVQRAACCLASSAMRAGQLQTTPFSKPPSLTALSGQGLGSSTAVQQAWQCLT